VGREALELLVIGIHARLERAAQARQQTIDGDLRVLV